MPEGVKEITDESFENEVIDDDGVVVVDYYATWCLPCKAIGAVMEELSIEYSDTLKIVKGDIEKNSDSVSEFSIQGVPAILIFKGGKIKRQHIGLRSKKDLKKDIEEVRNETV